MSYIREQKDEKTAFGEAAVAEINTAVSLDFPYNINSDIVDTTTTGSGTVTQSNSKAVLQTTAASSSSAEMLSKDALKYEPGIGGLVRFTALFTTGAANSTQIIGIGDSEDGYFFGYNGTSFGILRRQNSVDTWVAQTAWSEDKFDGTGPSGVTIDHTKGNVFQIRYQWLGFGMISFYIENPSNGELQLCHRIEYANANTTPSIFNPSLPLCAFVENTTNNTNIKLETSSMAAFTEGVIPTIGPVNSISNTKTNVGTTQTNILTIRNKSTFQSKTNRVRINLEFLTVAADGTKNVEIQVTKNTTLGGTPSYTDISTNTSVVEYDTAGTTISGGQRIFTIELGKTEGRDRDLTGFDVILNPGETLTFSGAAASSTSDISAACAWIERF